MSFIKLYSRLFTPLGLQVFLCLVWRAEQHSQPDSSSLATHKMVGWRILYWPGPGREPGMFSNWFIDCEDRKQQSDIYCRGGDKARISSITVLCLHVLFSQPQPPASLSPTQLLQSFSQGQDCSGRLLLLLLCWMGSVVFKMMTRRNNLNRSLLPGPGLTSEAIKTSYKSQQDSLLLSTVHTLGPDWRGCVIHALHSRLGWAGMATCGRVSGFYKFVCSGEGHLDGDNRMLCKECKLWG